MTHTTHTTHTAQTPAAEQCAAPVPAPAPAGPAHKLLARSISKHLIRPVWYALVAYGSLWLPGAGHFYGDALTYAARPGLEDHPGGRHLRSS